MTIAVDAVYENGVLKPKSPLALPDEAEVHLTIEAVADEARTPLGRTLRALRAEVLASGARTLDWDEITEEVKAHRGGWREGR